MSTTEGEGKSEGCHILSRILKAAQKMCNKGPQMQLWGLGRILLDLEVGILQVDKGRIEKPSKIYSAV